MNGEVIWTSGKRITAVFNRMRNNIRREAGSQIIKWTILMGDNGGELFSKSYCYFYVAGEEIGVKGDGFIEMGFSTFPIRDLIMLHDVCDVVADLCV